MNNSNISEKDWRLFRQKVPGWQERYMERLCRDYSELLNGDGAPSEKFWALHDRIKDDKRGIGVLIEMRRSLMLQNLVRLLREAVITPEELDGFSDELREQVNIFL